MPTCSNLYAAMEYVLTLSVTQVNFEQVISKLKIYIFFLINIKKFQNPNYCITMLLRKI